MPTMFDIPWNAVVIDEAHLVLPTEEDDRRKMTQFWRGLSVLDCYRDGVLRLPLTGTPDRGGRLERRYGTYKWLHPRGFTNYFSWVKMHFRIRWEEVYAGRDQKTGRPRTVQVPNITGLLNEASWNAYQHEHMVRRTKGEMLEGLPQKQWAGDGGIDMPMTSTQKAFYTDTLERLEEERRELIAAGEEGKAQAMRLQMAMRARQASVCTWEEKTGEAGECHWVPVVAGPDASAQLAWIENWLDERGYLPNDFDATLGKVVITSYFVEELFWLQKELQALGVRSEVLSGDTAAPDKKRIEQEFQRGDLRVILLSGHIGVSINLDAADDMIFIDWPLDPDKVEQAEDRIHRASRNHQVTYWRLVPKGTIMVDIVREMDKRYRDTRKSYDGSRGVSFERQLLGLS
jgi:hypothetical protein